MQWGREREVLDISNAALKKGFKHVFSYKREYFARKKRKGGAKGRRSEKLWDQEYICTSALFRRVSGLPLPSSALAPSISLEVIEMATSSALLHISGGFFSVVSISRFLPWCYGCHQSRKAHDPHFASIRSRLSDRKSSLRNFLGSTAFTHTSGVE